MDSMFGWAGVAALSGLVVAVWGYIRWAFTYASSFLIMSFECHDDASAAALAYCHLSLKASQFGDRLFRGEVNHVRPLQTQAIICSETVGMQGRLYWLGWRPLWIARTAGTTANNDHTQTYDKPIRITTFRPFFNVDAFLLQCVDFVEDRIAKVSTRHRIYYHTGTLGVSMMQGDSPELHISSSRHNSSIPLLQTRYLRWTLDEVGPPIDRKAVGKMALSQKALLFAEECRRWLGSKAWFLQRGAPWKLGALFYGTPGCGKTAMVRALAQELDLPVHVFDLASMRNRDLRNKWGNATADLPAIVLFEDIDSVFDGRNSLQEDGVTFDCLLNCLDGVERADGLLTIVTTNKPETLDDALRYRPGRIDVCLEFGLPTEDGRRHIAERILADWPELIEDTVQRGAGDSGAKFERRCIETAHPMIMKRLEGE